MPLRLMNSGECRQIQKINGDPKMRKRLEDLGFVVGGQVRLLSSIQDNLIVEVKNCRIALSKELASKIQVVA